MTRARGRQRFHAAVLARDATCRCTDPTCPTHAGRETCESPATCATRPLAALPGFDNHDPALGLALCAPCQDARSRKRNAPPDVREVAAVMLVQRLEACDIRGASMEAASPSVTHRDGSSALAHCSPVEIGILEADEW